MPEQPTTPLQRLQSMLRLSIAAWSTVAVGCLLLVVTMAAWVSYSFDPSRLAWGNYMTWRQGLLLTMLWTISCLLTYWSVRLWMRQPPIGDAALRMSWNQGKTWLASHSAGLTNAPVFIVLGCWSRHLQTQVFVSGQHAPQPEDASDVPIDWVFTDEGVMLVCRDMGVYNRLLKKTRDEQLSLVGRQAQTDLNAALNTASGESLTDQPLSSGLDAPAESADESAGPVVASNAADAESENAADAGELDSGESTGGESAGGESNAPNYSPGSGGGAAQATPAMASVQTLAPRSDKQLARQFDSSEPTPFQTLDRVESLVAAASADVSFTLPAKIYRDAARLHVELDSVEKAATQGRMSNFCTLLKAARFPLSPINGTLVLVDPDTLGDEAQARSLGRAIRSDLDQLQAELGVSSPTTTLVVTSRDSEDFTELARRLNTKQQPQRGLGQSFDVQQIPTAESLCQLVDGAVAATGRKIEDVLGDPQSLTQPNNHRLVRLAIRCRSWRRKLQWLMVESCATGQTATNDPTIVSGLYVAGTGTEPLRKAWLQAVMRQLSAEQNHLVWTLAERGQQQRQRRILNFLMVLNALLVITLLYLLAWPK